MTFMNYLRLWNKEHKKPKKLQILFYFSNMDLVKNYSEGALETQI